MQRKKTPLRRQDAGENDAVERVTERGEFRRKKDVSKVKRRKSPTPLKKVSGGREFSGREDVSEVERVSKRREFRGREDVSEVKRRRRPTPLKKVRGGREFRGREDVSGVERR